MRTRRCTQLTLCAVTYMMALPGGTIGQWDGSIIDPARGIPVTWNHPLFTKVNALVTAAGHTVGPDAPATAANLAQYDTLLMRGAARALTAEEAVALGAWVAAGGLLLDFADSDTPTTYMNPNLAAIGSSMSFKWQSGGSVSQNFCWTGGLWATTTPNNVVGFWMNGTPGTGVQGGNELSAGTGPGCVGWPDWAIEDAVQYVHWEQIGLGYIIAFADSLDHNYFVMDPGTPRANFFENVAACVNPFGGDPPPPPPPAPPPPPDSGQVPEPGTLALAAAGLAGISASSWCSRRRRTRSRRPTGG